MSEKIKLVCGHCAAVNQFDRQRPIDAAICGKCKNKLAEGKPLDVGDNELRKHLQHSGLPVLVDFWAPWCGPCKMFAPTYQRYAADHADTIRCLKLDTEQHQQAGAQFNIRSIPTLVLFVNGSEASRKSGAMNQSQLEQWVTKHLN